MSTGTLRGDLTVAVMFTIGVIVTCYLVIGPWWSYFLVAWLGCLPLVAFGIALSNDAHRDGYCSVGPDNCMDCMVIKLEIEAAVRAANAHYHRDPL